VYIRPLLCVLQKVWSIHNAYNYDTIVADVSEARLSEARGGWQT